MFKKIMRQKIAPLLLFFLGLVLSAVVGTGYALTISFFDDPTVSDLPVTPNGSQANTAKIADPFALNSFSKELNLAKPLTLQDAILLALRFNPDIQSAELQRVIDKFQLEVSYYNFKPQFTLNGGASFEPGKKTNFTLTPGVALNNQFGTQIATTFNNQLLGNTSPSIGLTVTQPLLQGLGSTVNNNYVSLQNQIDQEQINKLNLKNTVMNTILTVVQQYMQLAQDYDTLRIQQLALKQQQDVYDEYKIKIKYGKMPPQEIIQQESVIAQQRYTIKSQENTVERDYQALLMTLGLKPSSKIKIDENIDPEILQSLDLEKSKKLALSNDVNYIQSLLMLKQDERELTLAKDQLMWKLDLTVNANITNSRIIKGVGQEIDQKAIASHNASLAVSVPLGSSDTMEKKAAVVQAETSVFQQKVAINRQKFQTETDVINAINALNSNAAQIKQAYLTKKLAEQSYTIEKIKWQHGRSNNLLLNIQLNNLASANSNIMASKIQYINALAAYQKTVGTLLDEWAVKIRY
jgi:outer membrane protein TolC